MSLSRAVTPPRTAPGGARSAALDVARGLAILGTLATNVWVFTHPDGLLGTVLAPTTTGMASDLAQVLPLGKSLALLSLLFGIGMELQRRSALRRGVSPGRAHRVRALVLFVEGSVHFLLVAEFDVLMGYAVAALIASPLLLRADSTRRRVTAVLLGTHAVALVVGVWALTRFAGTVDETAPTLDTPYADGTPGELVLFRLDNLLFFRAEPIGLLLLSTAVFLLGAGLVRHGLLDAPVERRGRVLRRRLLVVGGAAVVAELLVLAVAGPFALLVTRYGTAVPIALGVLALVVTVQGRRERPRWLGRRSADIGRAALSCYVLQNLLAGALCHGWGLGLAARTPEAERGTLTAVVYLVVAVAVVTFAAALARTGRRGPLEALSSRVQRGLGGGR